MGHTIEKLSSKEIEQKPIFDNRFVIEICERVHFHYRNVRITQTLDDFINMAEGIKDALERWKKRGCPGTGNGVHIELCRKNVAIVDEHKSFQINLNDNLYKKNEGIFSDGAGLEDDKYIHLKLRDVRVELSMDEFKQLARCVKEADEKLQNSSVPVVL